MATIEDVARRAGVARSTVSYALSGKRSISAETRRRIERAIADLDFTPNAGARALATSQTMVLGVLLQFHQDEFAPAMLQYVLPISTTARDLGYDILMVTTPTDPGAPPDSGLEHGRRHHPARRHGRRSAASGTARRHHAGGAPRPAEGHRRAGHRRLGLRRSCAPARGPPQRAWAPRARPVAPPQHVVERGGSYAWRFRDAEWSAPPVTACAFTSTTASHASRESAPP